MPRCWEDSGLAGKLGEGTPDGRNSGSSRVLEFMIQQQREAAFVYCAEDGRDA